MNILSRYVIKELVSNLLLGVFVLVSVFLTVDFLGRVWEFLDKGLSNSLMFEYFIMKTPWVIYNMLPVACLLATLITFSEFSKNNEIIAMYAGGVSLWRITFIVISLGLIMTGISFLINEFIVPGSMERTKYIRHVHLKGLNYKTFKKNKIWYRGKNLIYNLQFFEPSEKTINGITIYFFDDNFQLEKQIYAKQAKWINNNWTLYDGSVIDVKSSSYPKLRNFDKEIVYLAEKPEDLTVIEKHTETISFRELKEYVHKSKRAGLKSLTYEVDMHTKIALPFACMVLMLLAIPFAITHKRSGNKFINIGYTIGFVMAYIFVQAVAISSGRSGNLPPVGAAWASNVIFLMISGLMISRTKT